MKIIDFIAILGALAWLPHLVSLVKYLFIRSKIRIITEQIVQIGFTTYGPIFNLRLAFAVERKDIVISHLKIRLQHETGEERLFEWQGITQQIGKMTLPNADVMPYEKEHSVLAIKLNQKDIEERFVRFQDPNFISLQRDYFDKSDKRMAYLKNEDKYNPDEFLRAEEMIDLYNFNKRAFPWKQGKYTAFVEVTSPEKFSVVDNVYNFNLSALDIEKLELNKEFLERDYKRIIIGFKEGDELINWGWVNPRLIKK